MDVLLATIFKVIQQQRPNPVEFIDAVRMDYYRYEVVRSYLRWNDDNDDSGAAAAISQDNQKLYSFHFVIAHDEEPRITKYQETT